VRCGFGWERSLGGPIGCSNSHDSARCYTPRTMRLVIDKDGHVDPVDAATLVTSFRRAWNDYKPYRLFYCLSCRRPFTADYDEETVHECSTWRSPMGTLHSN
jgi:hypothetical protein